jgi:hypothetical protein
LIDIGGSLAAARRARGLELADVERRTQIRTHQLAALEAERWDELPGRAYARAFLRTYATALGLDADSLVYEFEERVPDDEPVVAPPIRRRRPPRRYRTWIGVIGAAAAAVVAIVAWTNASPQGVDVPPVSPPPVVKAKPKPLPQVVTKRPVDRRLVIRAALGNCWLQVRRGGPNGPILYQGTLTRGSVARFWAPRVWIRLGAPSVVDIHRGSHHLGRLPVDPTNVVA